MTDGGGVVRSVCDSRQKFFRQRQDIQTLISTEGILRRVTPHFAGDRPARFPAVSQMSFCGDVHPIRQLEASIEQADHRAARNPAGVRLARAAITLAEGVIMKVERIAAFADGGRQEILPGSS
jgi:hypothetical protein